MPESVYIETTIPSYLTARPSANEFLAMHQQLTRRWWDEERSKYQLYASQVVLDEVSDGDSAMAAERLKLLDGVEMLRLTDDAQKLAQVLLKTGVLPAIADRDAAHIAIACVHDVNFVLSWNCKHIANPHIQKRLLRIVESYGFTLPILTTPSDFILAQDDSYQF